MHFSAGARPTAAAPAAAPKLTIEITPAPPADAGGPDKLGTITGRITGECKDCTVILLAKGGPFWYLQPWADGYRTIITDNKTFKNETQLGSHDAAILADRGYEPPARMSTVPEPGNGVFAVAMVEGKRD